MLAHLEERDRKAALLLPTYRSGQRSIAIRDGTFGRHFARVTRISIAAKNRARYVEMFLDRYHAEKHLIQEARPQTRVPLTRKHGGD